MIDTIYVEEAARSHPRTESILARFPRATQIFCDRYQEVFNPRPQNFRLQKQHPALILAEKYQNRVMPAPAGYGIGGVDNRYFSHMLNCVYDCRYCFLQGMYQSANYVLFVNYEDFEDEIRTIDAAAVGDTYFFSGYDCDSLALEGVTGFLDHFLPLFRDLQHSFLELRTKSVNTSKLLRTEPTPRVVVAWSLSPDALARDVEHGAPPVASRIAALAKVAAAGWPVGLRFDPLIDTQDFQDTYRALIDDVFAAVPADAVHSVSVGPLRFPKAMFQRISDLYPEDPMLAGRLERRGSMMTYGPSLESEMHEYVQGLLAERVPQDRLFACLPEAA